MTGKARRENRYIKPQRAKKIKQSLGYILSGFIFLGIMALSGAILLYLLSGLEDLDKKAYSALLGVVASFGAFLVLASGLLLYRAYRITKTIKKFYHTVDKQNRNLRLELKNIEKLNENLQLSERKNKNIIDAVREVIFETDEKGRLVFLNMAWSKLTGFEIEQSVGQSIFSMIHQDDQEALRQEFEKLLLEKLDRYQSFTQVRKADGTFRSVEISISLITKDHNNEIRFVGTMTDIEERRRAERALGEAEKKYRNIVQNAAGGIYQLTPEGLYLSANPAFARILGFKNPEQLLREVKNANESIYADEEKQRQAHLKKLEKSQEAVNREVQMHRRDGSLIWVSENARAVRDEAGHVLFIEGSIEDITERKKTEMLIRESKMQSDLANRAKSEFLSNMSHELRTPLNSIIGFSEMIKNEVFGPVEQRAYWEYAKDIYESGQGLLRVINEILDISKIEAGERHLNEGVINVRDIARECLGLMEHKLENSKLVVTDVLDDAPELIGEELAVKQMLMNLLSNAIKFTPDGGRITLSSHLDDHGCFHLSITDTGVGLDEEGIKKALSPFGQVNSELSRSGSGTGLGLTLVDSLIKLHGGELELFSQKGIGTTVTLIFPENRVVKKAPKSKKQSANEDMMPDMLDIKSEEETVEN